MRVPFVRSFPGNEAHKHFLGAQNGEFRVGAKKFTIRDARITILIPLEYFDVMDMTSSQKRISPEFSDVIIAYVVGGEARDANPTNYEKEFGQSF